MACAPGHCVQVGCVLVQWVLSMQSACTWGQQRSAVCAKACVCTSALSMVINRHALCVPKVWFCSVHTSLMMPLAGTRLFSWVMFLLELVSKFVDFTVLNRRVDRGNAVLYITGQGVVFEPLANGEPSGKQLSA